jgi:adenylate cyclase class 2
MPREVEIKIRLAENESELLNLWLKKNAKFSQEVHQLEYYLNNPGQSFMFTHKANYRDAEKYLRVRSEKGKGSVCLKIFKIDQENNTSENLDEVEFEVSDDKAALKLLKLIGFSEAVPVDKTRKKYNYKNFEIVVDSVKGLGDFAEFELLDSEPKANIKSEFERIYQLLREIGFKKISVQQRGYISMLWNKDYDFSKQKNL